MIRAGCLSKNMAFFRKKSKDQPQLDRSQTLHSVPVLNQLVTMEYNAEGNAVLNLPRKRTSSVKLISRFFRLPPYKQIELDELGTCVVELCDGTNTVSEIITRFSEKFRLNRRESEVSMLTYLKTLAKRGIIAFVVPQQSQGT